MGRNNKKYITIKVEVDVTQTLKTYITIKDSEGRRMIKAVEYEWKPAFCEKWQKGLNKKGKLREISSRLLEFRPNIAILLETRMKKDNATNIKKLLHLQGTYLDNYANHANVLNKKVKLMEIISRLLEFQPNIVILLETRVKKDNATKIRKLLHLQGIYLDNNANHANGRIWIIWDNTCIDIRVISSTSKLVQPGVYDLQGKFHYRLTAIYALNTLDQRRILWKDIEAIHGQQ
ncbi:hypothetical protein KIW84_UN0040 [Lathyrus oleraceus]|nr:hypothetical protein KIW84_UN0040 [Pisum sativum]